MNLQSSADTYCRRRERLARTLQQHLLVQASSRPCVVVLFSPPITARNNDVDHPFRPDSDLAYLTGFLEPGAVLVMQVGAATHSVLFVRPKDKDREVWDGRRAGPDGAKEMTGVDEAFPLSELAQRLPGLLMGHSVLWSHLGRSTVDDGVLLSAVQTARSRCRRQGFWPTTFSQLGTVLHRQRQIKDADEIQCMEKAVSATATGHLAAMAVTRPGLREADVEAALSFAFRKAGAQRQGYEPIVAGGANACILHYIENSEVLRAGDLLLIDAGAEVDLYTGDVTRTFPISGTFTEAQARIYDVVLAANETAIEAVRPGSSLRENDEIARRVLAEGLRDLGVLSGSVEEIVTRVPYDNMPEWSPGKAPLDRFYMHSTGHWLGMDVHDVGPSHDGEKPEPFVPGMLLTIEPGLYFAMDDDTVAQEYRGIGIRIEDDILVTKTGCRVLSEAIPKKPDEMRAIIGTKPL